MSHTSVTSQSEIIIARAIRIAIHNAREHIDNAWAMNPRTEHNERQKALLCAGDILACLSGTTKEHLAFLPEPKRSAVACILESVAAGAAEAVGQKSVYCLLRLLDPEGVDADRLEYAVSILEAEHFGIMHPGTCPRCGAGSDQHETKQDKESPHSNDVCCKRCGAYVPMALAY